MCLNVVNGLNMVNVVNEFQGAIEGQFCSQESNSH
jgi:hypothetical protein